MDLEMTSSSRANGWEYGIGAMKITANQGHNNCSGQIDGVCRPTLQGGLD